MFERLSNPFGASEVFRPPRDLLDLPEELLLKVLGSLPKRAFYACRLVCRKLYRISCDRELPQMQPGVLRPLFERLLQRNQREGCWWKGLFEREITPLKRIAMRGTALHRAAERIEELELASTNQLNSLKNHFKNLSRLKLSRCFHLSDRELARLPRTLRELNFAWSRNCSDRALALLPPKLKVLKISPCYGLTAGALRCLPSSVEELILTECYQIRDQSFKLLPEGLKKLTLISSGLIKGRGMKHLPKSLDQLELKFCPISPLALKELPESLKRFTLDD